MCHANIKLYAPVLTALTCARCHWAVSLSRISCFHKEHSFSYTHRSSESSLVTIYVAGKAMNHKGNLSCIVMRRYFCYSDLESLEMVALKVAVWKFKCVIHLLCNRMCIIDPLGPVLKLISKQYISTYRVSQKKR